MPSTRSEWKTASALIVRRLRSLAVRALARMYRPDEKLFVFRVQRNHNGIVTQGLSRRYSAITLIGLATEEERVCSTVLAGGALRDVCERLMREVAYVDNLGDVALTLWAAYAVGYLNRRPAWERLLELSLAEKAYPVVELAWTLAALCIDTELPAGALRDRLARRLIASCGARSAVFPHVIGENGSGLRSHVSCFADLVYPVHALAHYAKLAGNQEAFSVATHCARLFCRQQGPAGQWWWHYDWRTGEIIEPYPVYAVHQDAMAPMALFALEDVAGMNFTTEIGKGLSWLAHAPELEGGSLIDEEADLIWRKVARREPGKFTRYAQAIASRFHPALRIPGLDSLFPVGAIDYEDRPYHLGWLLYAWPPARVARWEDREVS